MDFKIDLNEQHHSVSVNVTVNSTRGHEAIQDYFNKIQEITKEFFFSVTKQYVPVYLDDAGHNKILAIKTVRFHLGCGLKEAKDLVEAPKPTLLHPSMPKLQAVKFVAELESHGAKATGVPEKLRLML